jgi:hypothetical protein
LYETSSKGDNYKLFKGELKFEIYLDILEDKDKFTMCRFRTTNHRLPVEVRRWKKNIRENRFCHYQFLVDIYPILHIP